MKKDELILVVKRSNLFKQEQFWTGFKKTNFSEFTSIIDDHKEFKWRSEMENDPSYKQIIPYLVFEHNKNFFLMQRKSDASEQRLKNKYSIGIGGHIRKEDIQTADIFDWAKREFNEEVLYNSKLEVKPFGIVNDDSDSVGQVHAGFVFILKGASADISIRSELKKGFLANLNECKKYLPMMETWSSIVLQSLIENIKPN